jgi:hypothetical protein
LKVGDGLRLVSFLEASGPPLKRELQMDEKKLNDTKALIAFFSTTERPVTAAEFMAFWKSCTDEQKDYYRNAEI